VTGLARGAWRILCLIFVLGAGAVLFQAFFSSCRGLHEYEILPYVEYATYDGEDGFDITEKRIGGQIVPRLEVGDSHAFQDHVRTEEALARLTNSIQALGITFDPETGEPVPVSNLWGKLGSGAGGAAATIATMLLLLRQGVIGGPKGSEPA